VRRQASTARNRPDEAGRLDEALAEVARQSGRQFDPRLVELFLAMEAEMRLQYARTQPLAA
jgi:response regulator RpfG family c-di-GMP phosphodiesterase